jgi:predicted Rossmann fold flavoprotein
MVRISGGGRCNVTHACFDPRALSKRYPRGGRALIGPFTRFQPRDTVAWFESRGVTLKTEADGRMFPVTDSSETIIDCLMSAAAAAGVELRTDTGVDHLVRQSDGSFLLTLSDGGAVTADRVLLATGGSRAAAGTSLAALLGHTIEPPVPSLFTFEIRTPWVRALSGLSVPDVEASIPGTRLRERGPLLFTHWGVTGPSILRLSAWGARDLHARDYRFELEVNWLPTQRADAVAGLLDNIRRDQPAKLVTNTPVAPLPSRLWEALVTAAGIANDTRWSQLPRDAQQRLIMQLRETRLAVTGKSLNKDEFVTCGGVRLPEVDFRTMESRVCPGLHLAGEVLDVDGVTGGFNFQAAWTTGWLAGRAMAGSDSG